MKKIYDKEKNVDTGEITEYLWRQYDYVWKEGVLDSAKITSYDEQTHELYNVISAKYLYDSENTPVGFIYTDPSDNTKNFKAWYVKNLQGDVTEVYVEGKGVAARYAYDAWGKIDVMPGDGLGVEGAFLTFAVTLVNPFAYRGYYLDLETYTYYLQSRYYDPQMGRFLNADYYTHTGISILAGNMFAYCNNNSVNYIDSDGYIAKAIFKSAGYNFLKIKKYYLAAELWKYAFEGKGKNPPKSLMDKIEIAIWTSSELWDAIYNHVKYLNKLPNPTYHYSDIIVVNYKSGDLFYSIGKMGIDIMVLDWHYDNRLKTRVYYLSIVACDKYDFLDEKLNNKFASFANGIGVKMQDWNYITPFWWFSYRTCTVYIK